ncbi:MAG TPA: divergent polysaccharide deacetylase family protein [Candidatus Baltobacteraceae bacterium]|nr:divergent polysaccharide deacetylase family protein [Candidatus Baltobacteraceae bacterium]
MRTAFWWALIAGALAAIGAGYVQASVQTQPPPVAQLRSNAEILPAPDPAISREPQTPAVTDAFAGDAVVADHARSAKPQWQSEQLRLVVGICGSSVAAESGFLRLHSPMAFVIDPAAAQARAFADLARHNGDALLVQVAEPPAPQRLAAFRRAIGPFDGIASRRTAGMAVALHGTGLTFFDERGDAANADTFARMGVTLVRRDVTADNLTNAGYVTFMLGRAAELSRRTGPVVVFVRPLASTLSALETFGATHDVRMIALQ